MPVLNCEISQSLLNALAARRHQTGETIDHIVINALADALQVEHATLFQISTAGALVEGVTQGAMTVGELARHGDFGLGTFADFNGEMVVVDGTTYQVTRDGVKVAPDEAPVPFAVVTHFVPEKSIDFATIASFDDLAGRLDALRNTGNEFFGFQLIQLGDEKQCQSVEAGPVIDLMRKVYGERRVPQILTSIRQKSEREREIAGLLRQGKAAEALEMKRADGSAILVAGGWDATARKVAALWKERTDANKDDPKYRLTVSAETNQAAREIGS